MLQTLGVCLLLLFGMVAPCYATWHVEYHMKLHFMKARGRRLCIRPPRAWLHVRSLVAARGWLGQQQQQQQPPWLGLGAVPPMLLVVAVALWQLGDVTVALHSPSCRCLAG